MQKTIGDAHESNENSARGENMVTDWGNLQPKVRASLENKRANSQMNHEGGMKCPQHLHIGCISKTSCKLYKMWWIMEKLFRPSHRHFVRWCWVLAWIIRAAKDFGSPLGFLLSASGSYPEGADKLQSTRLSSDPVSDHSRARAQADMDMGFGKSERIVLIKPLWSVGPSRSVAIARGTNPGGWGKWNRLFRTNTFFQTC